MAGSLARVLSDSARKNADLVAMSGDEIQLTYAQWLAAAFRVADELKRAGAGRGETLIIRCSNHVLDFVAVLGVWLADAVAVPVHRTTPPDVFDAIQSKAKARLQIDLTALTNPGAAITELPGDESQPREILSDAALVVFTSGSTGLPKGVVLTHTNFAAKLEQYQKLLGFVRDDRVLLVLNNTFSFGIWLSLLTLSHGARLIVKAKFTPPELMAMLARHAVTRVGVVPTMMRAVFANTGPSELMRLAMDLRQVAKLRDVYVGGEAMGMELSSRLRELLSPARLCDGYGSTETSTGDAMLFPVDYESHSNSIGKCLPGIRHRIASGTGEECPSGITGELQIDTPYIMAGYLDEPEMTRAAFVGPWFKTGDAAVDDGDGFIRIVGRIKELIVRGGNKITPLEVEIALCKCRNIASAMVAGIDDAVLGQRLQALIVPVEGAEVDAARLRQELLGRIEKFKVPDFCYVGASLPTGRTGKLDRRQLASLAKRGEIVPLADWSR